VYNGYIITLIHNPMAKKKTLADQNAEREAAFRAKQHQRAVKLENDRKKKRADRKASRKAFIELHHQRPKTTAYTEDAAGNPTGGVSAGLGINIAWQNGPRGQDTEDQPEGRQVPNGASVDSVIELALDRLKYLDSKLPSDYNKSAIESFEKGLESLKARKIDRETRGVIGTDKD